MAQKLIYAQGAWSSIGVAKGGGGGDGKSGKARLQSCRWALDCERREQIENVETF
jgi:hypothetical protein